MDSSTLHSNRRLPRLALRLAATAVIAWMLCAAYTLWLNPEIRFLKTAGRVKQRWAAQMTRDHGAKILVFGGSSCTFSIDAERLLKQHGMPAVNMGLFADCGTKTLTEWALSETKPSDTLIVALEPKSFSENAEPTASAVQFCYAMHSPQWIRGILKPRAPLGPGSLLALRPGGQHACTLLGKILRGGRMFRYDLADIQPSGWVNSSMHRKPDGTAGHNAEVSPQCGQLLRSLASWSLTNRVRVCYSLPLAWCAPDQTEEFQRNNARFLIEISKYLPVLKDARLGAHTNDDWFADVSWHLTEAGAAVRTDELAGQVRAWRMWDVEELRALVTNAAPRSPVPSTQR